MKKTIPFFSVLLISVFGYGQAYESAVHYQNKLEPTAVIELPAEAKYKGLANEGEELENKRAGIEKKIAENKNDQQVQLKEIENQKQRLTQWVSQRKS